ncbi:MAG TPA: hypothetical protein DHW22_07605 [Planctomycetaceae bacterium]|nr:hypothetical protein [Planctomycetaceae bacterium]
MDVKWDYELSGDQRDNPVMYSRRLPASLMEGVLLPDLDMLLQVFKTKDFKLQTSSSVTEIKLGTYSSSTLPPYSSNAPEK